MEITFEQKPTGHKGASDCKICGNEIKRGDWCLIAHQYMFPGERVGRVCIECLKKKIKEIEK
jgi:hypothetical protein